MTRFVFVADTHLQSTNPRNVDRLRAFDQVIAEQRLHLSVGCWVHVGDVFHSRSTPDDRNAVAERFQAMADVAPLVVLYGNHEAPTDLDVFAKLKAQFPICVVNRPMTLTVTLANGRRAAFGCIPFPSKAGLVAQGTPTGDVQLAAAEALDAILMQMSVQLAAAKAAGCLVALVGHGTLAGAVSSVGQPMGQFGEIAINVQHLQRLDSMPKIFGHIHKPQEIHGAHYVGSICRMDYGEVEEKRYLTADFGEDGTFEIVSHPLVCPPRWHVEGELTRDSFTWHATAGPNGPTQEAPSSWKGCEVRCRVRFKQSERNTLAMAQVHAEFAEALRLEVEPLAVGDRELRAPGVALARTLPEKLAAYAGTKQLADTLMAKLAALEHTEQQQILTDVRAKLALLEAGDAQKAMVAA